MLGNKVGRPCTRENQVIAKRIKADMAQKELMVEIQGKRIAYIINATDFEDGKGFRVGIAVEGKKGYYKTDWWWNCTYAEAQKLADEKNSGLGLDKKEAIKIVFSTMSF
ncbi:MAG TPA: hypothetical protein ACFYEK_10990 [Candidatus Wunengus sp. YC60]|uniref:hypothetical protein n=1 Tax=Candidatus Wunengus sp. YC60 TaxID=3367697 RepID=UPI004028FF8B